MIKIYGSAVKFTIFPTEVYPSIHLERPWRDIAVFARPNLFDKLGIGSGNLPLHAQRVVFIQFICVFVFEEVIRQWGNITQTLQKQKRWR